MRFVVAALVLSSSTAWAGDGRASRQALCDPALWPEADRAPIAAAMHTGEVLAARDRLAWEATDRLVEAVGANPPKLSTWVIDDGATPTVRFVEARDGGFFTVVRVSFDAEHPNGVVSSAEPVALAADDSVALRARAILTATADPRFLLFRPTYNPDVLPWSDDPAEGWEVFLVPGATDNADVPVGGGYRVHVSPDGGTVLDWRATSKTVLSAPVDALRADATGMFMASVLTPYPDATYFAWPRIWHVQMVVVTQDAAWMLGADGERVCRIDMHSPDTRRTRSKRR